MLDTLYSNMCHFASSIRLYQENPINSIQSQITSICFEWDTESIQPSLIILWYEENCYRKSCDQSETAQ